MNRYPRIWPHLQRGSASDPAEDVDDIEDSDEDTQWSADPEQLSALLSQGVELLARSEIRSGTYLDEDTFASR